MSSGPASVVDAYGDHVYGVVAYNAASVLTVLVLAGAAVVVALLLPRRRALAAAAGVSLALAVGMTRRIPATVATLDGSWRLRWDGLGRRMQVSRRRRSKTGSSG